MCGEGGVKTSLTPKVIWRVNLLTEMLKHGGGEYHSYDSRYSNYFAKGSILAKHAAELQSFLTYSLGN